MIVELGHFALLLAACVALVQTVVPLVGAHKGWAGWMALAAPAATAQLLLTAFSFSALTYAFVVSDFSVLLVVENSHSMKPMLYKVTGVWGNHEGSMLLWVLILTLYGALAAWFGGNLPPTLKARVLGVQAAVTLAFMIFIIFTSNPFLRLAVPPLDGSRIVGAFLPPRAYIKWIQLDQYGMFFIMLLLFALINFGSGLYSIILPIYRLFLPSYGF